MKKIDFAKIVSSVKDGIVKNSPAILTGFGVAGIIATAVTAVSATPKALRILDEEREAHPDEKVKPMTAVKLCWKCYIPSLATGVTSIACVICANSVNSKRNAALATAYSLSESAFRTYKEKVIETIGETKEKKVTDAVAKDTVEKRPVSNSEVVIVDSSDTLCHEYVSGRYFKCNIDKIKKAEITINRMLLSECYVSLNDFFYEIGLPPTQLGEQLGWRSDKLPISGVSLELSSQLAENDQPCLVINYNVQPTYGYQELA